MVIFTLAIVFITCMGQHLWKVGVRRVRRFLRSQAGSSSRSLPVGAGEREEGEEKKERGDGATAATDVRQPMYLPPGGVEPVAVAAEQPQPPDQDGDGTAAETQVQRPMYLPPGPPTRRSRTHRLSSVGAIRRELLWFLQRRSSHTRDSGGRNEPL